jgi:serine/threonine protein kinase/tetratricopeptide (TPR) repeat protein
MPQDTTDPRILELVVEWERQRDLGTPVTPEELCRECPELLDQLKSRLTQLKALNLHIGQSTTVSPTTDAYPTLIPGSTGHDRSAECSSGRYRPIAFHARGGLGEVHRARDEELRRDVALKRIQARYVHDLTSRRRFLDEAEITAQLEHPGIVPVYGLVQDDSGNPHYAMRFIEGETLADAIKRYHQLPNPDPVAFRQLLGQFMSVCKTIAYAHSRGVMHRDLKPSNVMLGKFGETLVVDWGLAKTFKEGAGLTTLEDASAPTPLEGQQPRHTVGVGTPEFMSPEQAAGPATNIGPACDTYSLGAMLYVILAGRAPLDRNDRHFFEKLQLGALPSPRKWRKDVSRALEAICLKAMARDVKNRYCSPLDLAAEVERWLADEPVIAFQEPLLQRARRWSRKHRTLVAGATAAGMVALVGLATGLIVVTDLNSQLEGKNSALLTANGQVALERDAAKAHQADTQVSYDFLGDMLAAARPEKQEGGLGIKATVREAVDAAAPKIAATFANRPRAEAKARFTLGTTYLYLGEYPQAIHELERARDLALAEFGPTHADTLRAMNHLAGAYRGADRPGDTLPLIQEVLRLRRIHFGPDHPDTLSTLNDLAACHHDASRYAEAVPLYEELFQRRKTLSMPETPDSLGWRSNLAAAYHELGRLQDAVLLLEETLSLHRIVSGPRHPATIFAMNNLANTYRDAGLNIKALDMQEQALKLVQEQLGAEHPNAITAMNNLAQAYRQAGRFTDAIALLERTLKLVKLKLPPDHQLSLGMLTNLAAAYADDDRHTEALPLLEESAKLCKAKLGPDNPFTLTAMNNLAKTYLSLRRPGEAIVIHEETLKILKQTRGPTHAWTLISMGNLADAYEAVGRVAEAVQLYEDAVRLQTETFGREHPETVRHMHNLATTHLGSKDYAAAEKLLLECHAIAERNPNLSPILRQRIVEKLVRLYDRTNDPSKAGAWRAKLPPTARLQDGLEQHSAWLLLWGWPRF